MTAIKAVIFDCFGVLYVDSKQSLLESISAERVQELRDIYQQSDHGFLGRDEYLQAVATISGKSVAEIEGFIASEHRFNEQLGDYIVSSLRPNYKIGMLSNIGRGWIDDFFDKNQIHDLFDAVTLSGEEGITKPHPRIYEIMAERLGVKPEQCIMIDDIPENCAGADAVGMKAIHYTSNQQVITDLKKLLAN
jgi:putative hydrolase of the HAD superfamily